MFTLVGMLISLGFKALSLISGEHGLDYYYGKKLDWRFMPQFQAKFKLETILEDEKVFSKG